MSGMILIETAVSIGISRIEVDSACITAIGIPFMILFGAGKLDLEICTDLFALGHATAGIPIGEVVGEWGGTATLGLMVSTLIGTMAGEVDTTLSVRANMSADG